MNKSIARLLAVSVVILLSTATWSFANAATYHVRKDGSDTSCNGSANASSASAPSCAFLTVQKGVNIAQAGDTVSVHAGDYSSAAITSARSGSSGSRIVIEAARGETVTLGPVTINSGHNYITVQGFQMTRMRGLQGFIILNGDYAEIINNYIYSSSSSDYNSATAIELSGSNNVIDGNTFDGRSTAPTGKQPSMFMVINIHGSNEKITNNTIKNMIDCERVFEVNGGNNVLISGNDIYNIYAWDYNVAHVDIFQSWLDPGPRNYIIENNYIHDLGTSQIGNLRLSNNTSMIFRNNIFANIGSSFFIGISNLKFYNNLFYRCATSGQDHALNLTYDTATNNELKNNIFYACGASDASSRGWYALRGNSTADYNFVANASNGAKSGFSGKEPHGANGGNPKFMAANTNCVNQACDFYIDFDSSLRDKGIVISGFSTDKDGRTRSIPWDIGAYEFADTNSILSPPQNLREVSQQ